MPESDSIGVDYLFNNGKEKIWLNKGKIWMYKESNSALEPGEWLPLNQTYSGFDTDQAYVLIPDDFISD